MREKCLRKMKDMFYISLNNKIVSEKNFKIELFSKNYTKQNNVSEVVYESKKLKEGKIKK